MWSTGLLTSGFRRRWAGHYHHGGTQGRGHRVSGWWSGSRLGPPLSLLVCHVHAGVAQVGADDGELLMLGNEVRVQPVTRRLGPAPDCPNTPPYAPLASTGRGPRDARRAADLVPADRANRTRRLPARHGSGHASRRSPPPEPGRRALTCEDLHGLAHRELEVLGLLIACREASNISQDTRRTLRRTG